MKAKLIETFSSGLSRKRPKEAILASAKIPIKRVLNSISLENPSSFPHFKNLASPKSHKTPGRNVVEKRCGAVDLGGIWGKSTQRYRYIGLKETTKRSSPTVCDVVTVHRVEATGGSAHTTHFIQHLIQHHIQNLSPTHTHSDRRERSLSQVSFFSLVTLPLAQLA